MGYKNIYIAVSSKERMFEVFDKIEPLLGDRTLCKRRQSSRCTFETPCAYYRIMEINHSTVCGISIDILYVDPDIATSKEAMDLVMPTIWACRGTVKSIDKLEDDIARGQDGLKRE